MTTTPRAGGRITSTPPRRAGRITGVTASETQPPLGNYESLSADQVLERLGALSQIDLAKVDSFERKHENRSVILSRIAALRGREPSPGHHERAANRAGSVLSKDEGEREVSGGLYGGMRESRDSMLEATTE